MAWNAADLITPACPPKFQKDYQLLDVIFRIKYVLFPILKKV